MQRFALFFICLLFGAKRGTMYIVCYMICGLLGIPVFSGFRGGVQVIFGLTGGYIVGFLLSAFLLWITERFWHPCKKKSTYIFFDGTCSLLWIWNGMVFNDQPATSFYDNYKQCFNDLCCTFLFFQIVSKFS